MQAQPVVKAGVAQPMKAPEPMVQSAKSKESWLVEVAGGYTLALTIVSALSLWYLVLANTLLA